MVTTFQANDSSADNYYYGVLSSLLRSCQKYVYYVRGWLAIIGGITGHASLHFTKLWSRAGQPLSVNARSEQKKRHTSRH